MKEKVEIFQVEGFASKNGKLNDLEKEITEFLNYEKRMVGELFRETSTPN